MKKNYFFMAALLLGLLPLCSLAQGLNWKQYARDTSLTFPQVIAKCDSLFAAIATDGPDTLTRAGESPEAKYRHWQRFWLSRLDSATLRPHNYGSGVLAQVIAGTRTSLCALESPLQQALPPGRNGRRGWQWLGPRGETNPNQEFGQWLGRVDHISINPGNSNEVYIANKWGGLWHSTNAAAADPAEVQWNCLTDNDPNYSGLGILALQVDYTVSPHRIYMALGHPANFNFVTYSDSRNYTLGLFYSPDNGQTFQHLDLSGFIPDMDNDCINDLLLHAVSGSSGKYLFVASKYKLLRLDVSDIAGGSLSSSKTLLDMHAYLPAGNEKPHRFQGFSNMVFKPGDHSKLLVSTFSNITRSFPYSARLYRVDNALTCTTANSCHSDITTVLPQSVINTVPNGGFGDGWDAANWYFVGSIVNNGTAGSPVAGLWKRINDSRDMKFLPTNISPPPNGEYLEVLVPNTYAGPGYDIRFDAELPAHTSLEVYMTEDKDNPYGIIGDNPLAARTLICSITTSGSYSLQPGIVCSGGTCPSLPGYADRLQFVPKTETGYDFEDPDPIKIDNVAFNAASWDYINLAEGAPGSGRIVGRGRRLITSGEHTDKSDAWYQYSDDAGASWTGTDHMRETNSGTMMAADHANSNNLYIGQQLGWFMKAGATGSIYTSMVRVNMDNSTYSNISYNGHVDVRAIASLPDGTVYVGNDGGISRYTTGGGWKNINGSGFTASLPWMVSSSLHSGEIGMAAHDNRLLYTHNGSETKWAMYNGIGDGTDVAYGKRNETKDLRLMAHSGSGGQDFLTTTGSLLNNAGNPVSVPDVTIYGLPLSRIRTTFAGEYIARNNANRRTGGELLTLQPNGAGTAGEWLSLTHSGGTAKANWPNLAVQAIAPDPYNDQFIACYLQSSIWESGPSKKIAVTRNGGGTWISFDYEKGGNMFVIDMCTDPRPLAGDERRLWISGGWYQRPGDMRVLVSHNTGLNWTDYSTGMPAGPVNALVYDEQSRYLFAGTDYGIYARYADDPDSTWNCFSLNLPNCFVTGLDINHCTRKLYASLMGRGVYAAALPPAKQDPLAPDSFTEWIINSNTTVSSSTAVYRNILVKSGATLTVTGCVLSLGRDIKITVEPEATLVVNNATLTNSCGDLWGGILLLGDGGRAQNTVHQAKVNLLNNAIIENAVCGISNYASDRQISGGIIAATGASFINNVRAVDYSTYHNYFGSYFYTGNTSSFNKCSFVVDDDFRGVQLGYAFNEHVRLYENEGIRFNGCSFTNAISDTELPRGMGIRAFNAAMSVKALTDIYGNITDRGHFEGFAKAIDISGALFGYATAPFIENTDFEKNAIGVCVTGVNNVKTRKCNFTVGNGHNQESVFLFSCYQNIGIYTVNTEQFQIENNVFTGTIHPGTDNWKNVGVRVDNSGPNNKTIYRNTFTDLDYGSVALGLNCSPVYVSGHPPASAGLEYICNTFNNNVTDINSLQTSFANRPIDANLGISKNQGSLSLSAGNTFNSSGGIRLNGQYMIYHHTGGNTVPIDQSGNNIVYNVASSAHSCSSNTEPVLPSGLILGEEMEDIRSTAGAWVEAVKLLFADSVRYYDSMLSELMVLDVGLARSIPEPTLRSFLLLKSPWLPDTLVQTLADSSVLTAESLGILLAANPDLVRNAVLINHLTTVPDPLSLGMADSLHALYDTVITPRTTLEHYIRDCQRFLDEWVSIAVTELKTNDTSFADSTSVPGILLSANQLWAYYEAGAFMSAKTLYKKIMPVLLDSIPAFIPLSATDSIIHQGIYNYWSFYDTLSKSKLIYHIDSAETAVLEEMLPLIPEESRLAQVIRGTVIAARPPFPRDSEPFTPLFPIPCLIAGYSERSPAAHAPGKKEKSKKIIQLDGHSLLAFPNPSNREVNFAYRVPAVEQKLAIVIVDLRGSKVADIPLSTASGLAVWQAGNAVPGTYLYKLYDGNRLVDWGKVVIIK